LQEARDCASKSKKRKQQAQERRALRKPRRAEQDADSDNGTPWWYYVIFAALALGMIGLFISAIVYGRKGNGSGSTNTLGTTDSFTFDVKPLF
jgi:hypothetical protein